MPEALGASACGIACAVPDPLCGFLCAEDLSGCALALRKTPWHRRDGMQCLDQRAQIQATHGIHGIFPAASDRGRSAPHLHRPEGPR